MPLYEFVCDKCGRQSEILVRSPRSAGDAACPHCGSKRLTKQLSVFASGGSDAPPAAECSGSPRSCGLCGTGKAHSH